MRFLKKGAEGEKEYLWPKILQGKCEKYIWKIWISKIEKYRESTLRSLSAIGP